MDPPDEAEDANDILRAKGSDGLRDAFDKAERKVIPLRDVGDGSAKVRSLRTVKMAGWDNVPVPEMDWTVRNRIPRHHVALFSGEGAAGKSTIMMQECAAHALARDWLGTLPEPGPALFFDAEDDEKLMHIRSAAIVRHYGVTYAELVRCGFTMVTRAGEDAVLAAPNKNGLIAPTGLYLELLEMVGDLKPAMISIASSANVFAGNEINRAEVQQFVGLLTRIAIVANGSVVLITHPSLTGIQSDTGLSGSTQWHNAVRARFYIKGVKADTDGEEPDSDLRELAFKKNNYGPIAEKITLRWRNGLFLPEKQHAASAFAQAAQDQKDDELFLQLLTKMTDQGRPVGPYSGPNYAPAQFADQAEAKIAKVTNKRLKAAMERLLDARRIMVKESGAPTRRRSVLVIAGAWL